jgi:hypothetical protein
VIPLYRLFEQAVVRDPLYRFLPAVVCGIFTAFVLAVQWLVGLRSDCEQSFEQHQSISKGAPR